jgi:hypothetical protein
MGSSFAIFLARASRRDAGFVCCGSALTGVYVSAAVLFGIAILILVLGIRG